SAPRAAPNTPPPRTAPVGMLRSWAAVPTWTPTARQSSARPCFPLLKARRIPPGAEHIRVPRILLPCLRFEGKNRLVAEFRRAPGPESTFLQSTNCLNWVARVRNAASPCPIQRPACDQGGRGGIYLSVIGIAAHARMRQP